MNGAAAELPRYALYWAPETPHPLWQAGSAWLGRDAADPARVFTAREATDEPRRYGFHATLKAPFFLREGASEANFLDAVRALAARVPAFAMPALRVATLGNFIALRPAVPFNVWHPLRRLADACVRDLEAWRRLPSDAEIERRSQGLALAPELARLLRLWGYPYVLDRWRFHMTLSNGLAPDAAGQALRERLLAAAAQHFSAALEAPLRCSSLCVFVEPRPGAPLVLAHRFGLAR